MYRINPPKPARDSLPTMVDLPSEDPEEMGLPDEFHEFQPQLLRETFQSPEWTHASTFIGTDINLYYDARNSLWHKRLDWFVVLGVQASTDLDDLRLSYVIWQESVPPFLVIELLSPGTEDEDLGLTLREIGKPPTKWEVYERILRVPYYVVFDRYVNVLRAFKLDGLRYQEFALQDQKLWLEEIKLGLGVWQGEYVGVQGKWLRWYDAAGDWVLTPMEQFKQEQQRSEQERQRAERLAARLRALGVDPDEDGVNP